MHGMRVYKRESQDRKDEVEVTIKKGFRRAQPAKGWCGFRRSFSPTRTSQTSRQAKLNVTSACSTNSDEKWHKYI